MISRKVFSSLRCNACDDELNEHDLNYYLDYEGFCQRCFEASMGAAYEDDWMNFDDDRGEDE